MGGTAGLKDTRNLTVSTASEAGDTFKLLVEAVKDYAIYMLDVNGYVESWNAGAERAKQYSSEEIIGKHFSVFYTFEDLAIGKPLLLLGIAMRDGRVEDEGWRIRKDGTRFWADVIVTAVYDKAGVHRGFAKVTRDMTERRHLIDSREEALRASSAKSAFLANMSHELRTPLNAIIGYTEMVEDNLRSTGHSDVADDLTKILYSANHLQSVINDILDLSRIEAGQLELKWETVDLNQVVREVIETVQPLASVTKTEIRAIPEHQGIQLTADRTRLKQILYNLLSNAAKFTHNGIISVKVWLDGTETPEVVHMAITDTGVGMAKSEVQNLFQRFYRSEVHVSQYNQGGTGLGLAICRMLCEAMGGHIGVESEVGSGSTFTVTLPKTQLEKRLAPSEE